MCKHAGTHSISLIIVNQGKTNKSLFLLTKPPHRPAGHPANSTHVMICVMFSFVMTFVSFLIVPQIIVRDPVGPRHRNLLCPSLFLSPANIKHSESPLSFLVISYTLHENSSGGIRKGSSQPALRWQYPSLPTPPPLSLSVSAWEGEGVGIMRGVTKRWPVLYC